MAERLTPAEHRVLQALLNLPHPVSVATLDLAASDGKLRSSRISEQMLQKIKRKRPNLVIENQRGFGYRVRGKLCECGNYCGHGSHSDRKNSYRVMCKQCQRMYDRGYRAGQRKHLKEVSQCGSPTTAQAMSPSHSGQEADLSFTQATRSSSPTKRIVRAVVEQRSHGSTTTRSAPNSPSSEMAGIELSDGEPRPLGRGTAAGEIAGSRD